MDPVAHTLAGAALAQTPLKKIARLAAPTLIIGANLPDVDAVMMFFGEDMSLYHRRGHTHGILAMILSPLLLAGGMLFFDRWQRGKKEGLSAESVGGLVLLSYIGVLSHSFLDWLNTYGVRLLMPFSGEWFYGDTLFIVDPWMWLLMAAPAVFATSHRITSKGLWTLLGLLTSLLITLTPMVPLGAKIAWWLGVLVIVGFRVRGVSAERNSQVAIGCLLTFVVYLGLMKVGNGVAREIAKDWVGHDRVAFVDLMTGPLPANPFFRDIVVKTDSHYHGVRVGMIGKKRVEPLYEPVEIIEPSEIVRDALRSPEIRGFANWVRYPIYEVESVEDGEIVTIRDLRYVKPGDQPGLMIGSAQVYLPRSEPR